MSDVIQPTSSETTDWRGLYPFASHNMRVASLNYHYLDEGVGRPCLFVHGNPTWSFYWRNLIQAFRAEHRCIAVDHIGCGLSDKPQSYDYSLSQHTSNLIELIDSLDLKEISLFVHDWGGAIGLGAAVARPQRFSQIVIFNTGAFPPPFVPWRIAICRLPWFGDIALRGFNAFARAAIVMATEKPERMTRPVRAGLLAPYDSWRNRIATLRFVQDIPFTRRHSTWKTLEELEKRLPSLAHLPTQMIWGMKDWCFRPQCLDRLLESLPNADVHRFADAGHYVVEDAYERIIPIVKPFLNSV